MGLLGYIYALFSNLFLLQLLNTLIVHACRKLHECVTLFLPLESNTRRLFYNFHTTVKEGTETIKRKHENRRRCAKKWEN